MFAMALVISILATMGFEIATPPAQEGHIYALLFDLSGSDVFVGTTLVFHSREKTLTRAHCEPLNDETVRYEWVQLNPETESWSSYIPVVAMRCVIWAQDLTTLRITACGCLTAYCRCP